MLNIIIPCYKSKKTLPKTLDSLVAQSKTLFYVTIVQDCDGEDYTDIINEYNKKLTIAWLQTPQNCGAGMARQYALDKSDQFDYVMFLDSDDQLFPNAVQSLYKGAKQSGADIIKGQFVAEQPGGNCFTTTQDNTNVHMIHGALYRTAFLKENGIRFNPVLRINEDVNFTLKANAAAKQSYFLNEPIMIYRCNQESLTHANSSKNFARAIGQQLTSLLDAFDYIYNKDKQKLTNLSFFVINIYKAYLISQEYNLEYDKDLYKKFVNNELIIKFLNRNKNMQNLLIEINQYCILPSKEVVYLNQSFLSWVKNNFKAVNLDKLIVEGEEI